MNKTRLFVIDDNESLVGMVKSYFKDVEDVEVVLEAHDGEEGISLIDKHKNEFDIIVLDLVMPKKDGIAVLEYLYNNEIDKKVIVLTSYNTQDMISKVASLGASYFMIKPFELDDLYNKVKNLTRKNTIGESNITSATHCATRLRLFLKEDPSDEITKKIESMPGVIQVVKAGGQYQIVIGTHAKDVYEHLAGMMTFSPVAISIASTAYMISFASAP